MGSEARDEILARVRAALGPACVPDVAPPRPPGGGRGLAGAALVELLVDRLGDYRADVTRASTGEVRDVVSGLLRARGARRVIVAPGLPPAWRPDGITIVEDAALTGPEMDDVGHVVTGCALAIAELGSLVFDHGPGQGRRALTLVPDHHVCVVREDQIVETLPEAFEALAASGRAGRPVTFVSGPSATSDIELKRVEGVHGPRRLDVVIEVS